MKKQLITLAVCLIALSASTYQLGVAWDRNTEPSLSHYKVYIGTNSRNYVNQLTITVPTNSTLIDHTNWSTLYGFTPVSNLINGRTYYFAVTALNTQQMESSYSSEVWLTLPATNTAPVALGGYAAVYQGTVSNIVLPISSDNTQFVHVKILDEPELGQITKHDYVTSFRYMANGNRYGYDVLRYVVSVPGQPSSTNIMRVAVLTSNLTQIAAEYVAYATNITEELDEYNQPFIYTNIATRMTTMSLSYAPGRQLQYNTNLATTNWIDYPSTNIPAVISNIYPACFFRLKP